MKTTELDTFTRAYIETALWSSTDNADESGGEPLDQNYSADDIAPAALAQMAEDCAAFQRDNAQDLEAVAEICDTSKAGHNFWLNRNGHGAGFWDEYFGDDADLRAAFTRLSDASKVYGSQDITVGDDGQLHV
jgi:hypothetical protein